MLTLVLLAVQPVLGGGISTVYRKGNAPQLAGATLIPTRAWDRWDQEGQAPGAVSRAKCGAGGAGRRESIIASSGSFLLAVKGGEEGQEHG